MLNVRRIAHVLLAVFLAMLTLAGVAQAGMLTTLRDTSGEPNPGSRDWPEAHPSSANGSIVVAVVLGRSGTVGSDALAPYEVFASSPTFSVYTVAESASPAPIAGGPALLPAHTFADVDSGNAPPPDVVVVPAVGDPAGPQEAVMRAWIRSQHERGAHILGICSGSKVLAATGLLEGRRATSHWSGIDALEKTNPEVHWVRGQRFVQDGSVTTTAGVTSGIPGALKVVQDLAGADEADRIGRALDYPGWSLGEPATIPDQHHTVSDLPVALALVLPWNKPNVGIGLSDDVGEIDLAAAFEVYSTSYAARPIAIASTGTITTRHGVVVATTPIQDAPRLDRIIVPGGRSHETVDDGFQVWARERDVTIEPLLSGDGDAGFDAALEDLAANVSRASALTVAKVIDYPVEHLELRDARMGWRLPSLSSLSLLLATAIGLLPTVIIRTRRRRTAASEDLHWDSSEPV